MRLIDADYLKTWFGEKDLYTYDYIIGTIDDAPTIEPEQHWIPCSERLPEPRIDVWCNSDLGQMTGFYDETTETWYRGDYLELLVNAWMPLPEPYQPGEESE